MAPQFRRGARLRTGTSLTKPWRQNVAFCCGDPGTVRKPSSQLLSTLGACIPKKSRRVAVSLRTVSRLTAALGLWCSLLVFILVGMNVVTGVSQEYFESTHPVQEYTERIIRDAGPLNAAFTVDNLFVVSYAAFFVGLGILFQSRAGSLVVKLGVGAILLVALLDSVENHHITAMAQAASAGVALSDQEIRT